MAGVIHIPIAVVAPHLKGASTPEALTAKFYQC